MFNQSSNRENVSTMFSSEDPVSEVELSYFLSSSSSSPFGSEDLESSIGPSLGCYQDQLPGWLQDEERSAFCLPDFLIQLPRRSMKDQNQNTVLRKRVSAED